MPRFGTLLSLLLLSAGLVTTATRPARAAVKEFPYEAVVEADEAYVRCGPGKNFYATLKLTRGQHVTVRRHDPGGWFMIDPPIGSFSLIRIEDVVQQGNIATVKRLEQGQACIRIGSSLDPTADAIFQRKLSTGERAEILGEVMIARMDRTIPMFRIRPPRGEFRWIEGNDLAALDPQIKQQQESDPFSTPPRTQEARRDSTRQPQAAAGNSQPVVASTTQTAAPKTSSTTTTAAKKNGSASPQQVVIQGATFDPHGRLEQIDLQFRDMIQKEPPAWNLAQIEQAYVELRRNPAAGGVANQVDLRFSALAHYKQVKAEYDDYYRLVSNTARRDAELAAVENSYAPQNSRPAIGPAPTDNGTAGNGPSSNPSGVANSETPPQSPTALPTLSMPGYSQQQQQQQSNVGWQSNPGQQFVQPQTTQFQPGQFQSGQFQGGQSPVGQFQAGQPAPQAPQYQSAQPQPIQSQPPQSQQPQMAQMQISQPQPSASAYGQPQYGQAQYGQQPYGQPQPQYSPPQNGISIGTPVPLPMENSTMPGSAAGQPQRRPATNLPNAGGAPSNSGAPASNSNDQASPQAAANSLHPDSDHATGGGETGDGQSQTTPAQPPASTVTPQAPQSNVPFDLTPNRPGAMSGSVASPGTTQNPGAPPRNQIAQPQAPNGNGTSPYVSQQMPSQGAPGQQWPSQQFGSPQAGGPQAGFGPNGQSATTPMLSPPRQIHPPGSPPLDGAGIVQRAAATSPNGPRHVLLAPNGRILAYLQGDQGVNLDAFVGRQMGVMGFRAYRPELQTDLIVVRGMIPVRLVQQ